MSHVIDRIDRYYNLKPTGILHVGANNGQEVPAYKELSITPVVLIEPLDDPMRRLKIRIGDDPGFYPVQACCSSVAGDTVQFRVASNGGQSSSFLAPASVSELYPRISFDETIPIVTTTLDAVVEDISRKEGFDRETLDYLAIDTQGSELHVLSGAMKTLRHIKYIWVEVSFGGLYEGDPSVYDMIGFLRPLGFDIYYTHINSKRWGDALFIRRGVVQST